MLLKTFVHISDLHLDDVPVPKRVFTGALINGMRRYSWIQGWLGHDDEALARLVDFFEHLNDDLTKNNEEPAELIVTGDITAWGKDSEFDVADAFLRAQLPSPPFSAMLGLSVSDWQERAIPGNHDHWPGNPVFFMGQPTPSLNRYFRWVPLPGFFIGSQILLSSGHNLRFIGLNSDAQVFPGWDRVLAKGVFHDVSDNLSQALPPFDPNEIRVLLVHHSPEHNGYTRYIDSPSLINLFDLLKKHHIHVVLTGHMHRHLLDFATVSKISPGTLILEARCGTTTQVRTTKLKIPGLPASNRVNSLLVHRLEDEGSQIVWHSKLYVLGVTGFYHPQNPYRCLPTEASTVVWPHQW